MKSVIQNEKMRLIGEEEIKHRASRKKKIPFSKYEDAINHTDIVEWIKDRIAKSKNGRIKVKTIDLVKELDIEFQNITYTAIYTALDYVLFKRDILVNTSTANNGDKLLVFRLKKDTDKAPYWIEKLLKKEIDVEKLEEEKPVIKCKIQLLQVIEEEENKEGESKEEISENKKIIKRLIKQEKVDAINKIREETETKRNQIRKAKSDMLRKIEIKKQQMLKELEKKEGYLSEVYWNNPYRVDILVFDFKKLGWKIKQSKTVYTNLQLLELIKQGISRPDDRHRIEITAIAKKEKVKEIEEIKGDNDKKVKEIEEIKGDNDKKVKEIEDKLSQLLPEKRDEGQEAAIKYLIQRYKKSYPNEKK